MKRYRNKKTGLIFEKNGYPPYEYVCNEAHVALPIWVVEDSCDWEEVKEVLFTTEDGVEITDPQATIYLVYPDSLRPTTLPLQVIFDAPSIPRVCFSSIEARNKYVRENKKTLSIKDIENYLEDKSTYVFKEQLISDLKDIAYGKERSASN